ncbi:MAG: ECF transporter S component [Andreesenia angusta]|nr:ECF transporter S component [Andreesenia angusta]
MQKTIERKNSRTKTRELVLIGLSIALIYIATAFLKFEIPTPNGGGLVHLGTGMMMIVSILFGRKTGAVSSAAAMGMFDIFSKYTIWAPTTIITRFIMGLIIGSIANKNGKSKNSTIRNFLAIIIGGAWMVVGYYIGEGLTFGNWYTPIASIGGNILQVLVGGILALILVPGIKKSGILENR